MVLARFSVAWRATSLEGRARAAARREERALGGVGAQVFSTLRATGGPEQLPAEQRATFEAMRTLNDDLDARGGLLERSLAADRRDFAQASQLVRWAVIGRGLFERVVLRDRSKRDRRALAAHQLALARVALDGGYPELRALVSEPLASEVTAARSDEQSARAERAKLLEPYGGKPVPDWLAAIGRELRNFLGFVWSQLSKKLFLRVPAIAGLLVGWWIASHYTDSTAGTVLANFGIGDKKAVSSEEMGHLQFWLPLLAAAVCSYIGWAIARLVQRKYAPAANETK